MRLLSKVVLGGSVVCAVTAGCLVAAGVFATSAVLVVTDPTARPARADELTAFDSCSALLSWYVERGARDVGPYGWTGPMAWADTIDGALDRRSAQIPMAMTSGLKGLSLDAVGSSRTGTNTQETEVDEPDVAKTDGSLVARIVGDRKLVLIDVAHGEPRVTHRYWLPKDGYGSEILLIGDRVLITQTVSSPMKGYVVNQGSRMIESPMPVYRPGGQTRILDVDISDTAAPRLLSTDTYSGSLLSLRQYDDTVRVVTATPRPELAWVQPHRGTSAREATRRNRALVRATTIEDWLPSVTRAGHRHPLAACADVFHPKTWSGADTVAVTTFGIDDVADAHSLAVTANGEAVYSSAKRLYVASTAYDFRTTPTADPCPRCLGALTPRPVAGPPTTSLHAFALDGATTTYLGSGHIAGTVRDRWSLDEYDGNLRVVWTRTGKRGATLNGITVLSEQAGRLEPIGSVGNLGTGEDVQSVRWLDGLAIVVTFRQVDPLYTVDLSDPTHPRTLGALKVPGYSGYLHPIGGDLVLGLGMAGDARGLLEGGQAAVFDISDPAEPRRISRADLGNEVELGALNDPRGFTWVDGSRTGVTAVTNWRNGHAHLVALKVSADGQLSSRVLADLNRDAQARTLELPGGRVAVLDSHRLRVVSVS